MIKSNKNLSNNVNKDTLTSTKQSISKVDDKKDIKFQILDWNYYNEEEDEDTRFYTIRLFGRTIDNKTIYVKIEKYTPYFFVEIEKHWKKAQIDALIEMVKTKVFPVKNLGGLKEYKIVTKKKMWGFTNYTDYPFLQLIFNDLDSMRSYERVLRKYIKVTAISHKSLKLKIYESNIEPFLRCMHIRKINAVGMVNISANNYEIMSSDTTCCDINISANWVNLDPDEDMTILPFVIASFDLECNSKDGSFPQAERDEDAIIQIGTTFSRYGETECFYEHIITLGSCDDVEGAVVETYETEVEVLMAWTRLMAKTNPDIVTGWNINGFDFKYMKDRATKLGIFYQFSKLSRITDEITEYKEKKLASSALGDNLLKYYDMTGRVVIDMMKVVQRDFKLDSYKLDFVSSTFIKETIVKLNYKKTTTEIITNSNYGVKKDQYLTVFYNDGITLNKHMDGKKFKIIKLSTTTIKEKDKKSGEMKDIKKDIIIVDGIIDEDVMTHNYKVFWCHTKDDISPHEIFRLQKGSSADRAIVAKYCLQDCSLCNKLISKLQILSNNIGMANVCHVPLSYLFMRGQGIKIFSLVLKKCREMNHLFPTLIKKRVEVDAEGKKIEPEELENSELFEKFISRLNNKVEGNQNNNDEDEDEDNGFEGAIVFKPKKGVYFEPVIVLDYASLYPNAMIYKNLSHECLVNDEKYADVSGYKYNTVTYVCSKIVEEVDKKQKLYSQQIFSKRKTEVIGKYKDLGYIIEDTESISDDNEKQYGTHIYDKDKEGNKRNLVAEVIISKSEFKLYKYETSIFAEKLDGSKGIIATILQDLLSARKKYKKQMDTESDPFKKNVLDGRQLAYKVTANSLYGQTGSSFSNICMKQIAASTTATGRDMLYFSKDFIENYYGKMVNLALTNKKEFLKFMKATYTGSLDKKFINKDEGWTNKDEFYEAFYKKMNAILTGYRIYPEIIYGDTDSVFYCPHITDIETNEKQKDKKALELSIQLGIWSSYAICAKLEGEMSQGYEKVLYPFAIITKKRYVGNLYETDPNKCYQKSMGIVLKRRDNAPIVKVVCGGIIDQILNKRSAKGAVEFTKTALKQILCGKFGIDKFIITKTLRDGYVDRTRIVQAVLADRMSVRDPGNKPMSNDRIPYAFVITKEEAEIQGDRVEHPDFIIKNKIPLDYLYYITNQIMKPCIQFLELLVEEPEQIFEEYIIREENRRLGKKTMKFHFDTIKNTVVDKNIDKNSIQMINFDAPVTEKEIEELQKKKPKVKAVRKPKSKVKAIETKDYTESDNGEFFKIDM
jgi:DNA polymerase elongation subunit (family B)